MIIDSLNEIISELASYLGLSPKVIAVIFFILVLWSTCWKGYALWKSAKKDDKWWFIALVAVNTVGILEIIYIFVVAKKKPILNQPEV